MRNVDSYQHLLYKGTLNQNEMDSRNADDENGTKLNTKVFLLLLDNKLNLPSSLEVSSWVVFCEEKQSWLADS